MMSRNPPDSIAAVYRPDAVTKLGHLVSAGANLDARDDEGRTALMHAAWLGRADLVNLLLAKGASPQTRDTEGRMADRYAYARGHGMLGYMLQAHTLVPHAQKPDSSELIDVPPSLDRQYDAVVVPGGGIDDNGKPFPWVLSRLEVALKFEGRARYFLVLSRGTPHKAPPLDPTGRPIVEAHAAASYLMSRGIPSNRILVESLSLDTIGNAYAALHLFAKPLGLKHLLIVTNEFHMRRTRAIFDWCFSLPDVSVFGKSEQQTHMQELEYPSAVSTHTHDTAGVVGVGVRPLEKGWVGGGSLWYFQAPNSGMSDEQIHVRHTKEEGSLKTLLDQTIPNVTSQAELARFLFLSHGAYKAQPHTHHHGTTLTEAKQMAAKTTAAAQAAGCPASGVMVTPGGGTAGGTSLRHEEHVLMSTY